MLVLVRPWGSRDWEIVELARSGQTWRGEVSCRQVSTITGPTRYFFLALDEHGESVLDSGSPDWPYVATVVGSLEGGARGIPGEPRPVRCHDPADCPPDFPGCPAYQFVRAMCRGNDDCDSGRCEWDGYCAPDDGYGKQFGPWNDEEQLARAIRTARSRHQSAERTTPPRAQ